MVNGIEKCDAKKADLKFMRVLVTRINYINNIIKIPYMARKSLFYSYRYACTLAAQSKTLYVLHEIVRKNP